MLEKITSVTSLPLVPDLLNVLDGKRDFNKLINSFEQIEVRKQLIETVIESVEKLEISQIKHREEVKELAAQVTAKNTISASSNELRVFVSQDNTCFLKEISPNSNTYWFHYL
ncbi:MAG: hypothetical protein WAQ98_02710 [Blastocatellia bacterium]|jgi:hypothetical protein